MNNELMRLERMKSLIRAIAELEIALNTFYDDKENFERVNAIYEDLKRVKEDYFD